MGNLAFSSYDTGEYAAPAGPLRGRLRTGLPRPSVRAPAVITEKGTRYHAVFIKRGAT
ncbi:Hypothetical protein SCLAV_5707 [Streptomyces clavuligerus]|uniref:Uncharacterized protein n=1 Tax=Streptomyces clavuligerus TaxID=1901 RepID=B5H3F1_STRCL|nr:hypothetical protein SSCG_06127 [Streptomyces clavuligerus]EFG10774.1 Hypothetical protein SCLAV_5707 [Streptomyces clavuligerus]